LVHLCLVAATVSGFTPSPSASSICRGATTTALGVAGGYHRNSNGQKKPAAAAQDDEDYWAGMPLRGGRDRSTEPVADRAVTASDRRRMEDVMIKEDYWLTWAMAMLGPLIIWYHPCTFFCRGDEAPSSSWQSRRRCAVPFFWLSFSLSVSSLKSLVYYDESAPTAYMTDGSPSLIGVSGGLFHILFAALLWVQTRRVRMVFDKTGFEFYNIKGPGLDLEKGAWLERKPDNYVAGTQNRWTYDSVINYGFFPSVGALGLVER
jgi:hypothetical protein